MKSRMNRRITVFVLSLVLMVSMGSWALAEDAAHSGPPKMGNGYHHGHMMKKEGGRCPMAAGCMGVSREDMQKIRGMCVKFFKDTLTLRRDIQSKQLALESEMVKTAPDAKRAMALQSELSSLKAQMAQKRLANLLEIKKVVPTANLRWLENCGGDRHMGMREGRMDMREGRMAHHGPGMMDDDD